MLFGAITVIQIHGDEMKVYYSGYGFIYDIDLDEMVDGYQLYHREIEMLTSRSCSEYRGDFLLPSHVLQDLKFIGKAKVDFLLYEDDHEPIAVQDYGKIESKNARLYLSDNKGNCHPIKIKMDCIDNQFNNEDQPDNTLLLFQNGELQTIKEIPDYLNPNHEMYSQELAAAIETWESVLQCNPPRPKKGTRKSLVKKHLENKYNYFINHNETELC